MLARRHNIPVGSFTLYLSELNITNFKNYPSQVLQLSPGLNCFTGLNGMGKTNVLEAVHFLCIGKDYAGLGDRMLTRHGADFFRLEGVFKQDTGSAERVIVKYPLGGRKEIAVNGAVAPRLSDFVGRFPVVMIAPDDVSLIQEGSEARRRFLDASLSQIYPEYLNSLLIYNQLLKQRNALLKHFGEYRQFDPVLLAAIDRQMPEPAALLIRYRQRFVEALLPIFNEYYGAISAAQEKVAIGYESELLEQSLEQLFGRCMEKDKILQRTSAGPHRDDLDFTMNGFAVRKLASQGQLKSFLLALRLSQFEILRREKGIKPLLLLDDIFDKLDENRVRQLIGLLLARAFGQIMITDTQQTRMEQIVSGFSADYRMFSVSDGMIA